MAAQLITVRLARGDAQPWGFRLQGGADFGTPLLVQKVNGGSLADQAGLMPGDAVIKINDMDIFPLRHKDAQDLVVRSGNTFVMTVQRGGSTWRPHVTPTGQMPSHQSHLGNNISTVTRTSLAHKQPQPVEHIGCGYNNAARPFNSLNGGDGHVKSIVNKQYNTPVGIYSEEAIAETLSAQAEVLAGGVLGVNFKKNEKEYNPTNSEVLKFLKEEESNPQEPEPYAPANFFWTASHAIGGCKSPGHPRTPTQQTDERVGTPLEQNTLAPTAAHRPSLPQTAPTTEPTNTTSSVPESTPVQTSWKPESSFQQQQRQQEQNQETSHMKTTEGSTTKSGLTQCDNCGMGIVGVFCRIKDKNLHVECFKCATCGTPLKNQGYYNYNNKLYCDIHAKLAAMQNPPPGTDGYIPIPIKPTPKLSASNIANALNAHGYNLQTNGATPHLITGPMPPSGNHDQNVTSSANPLQVSHSRASSSSSTSSGTTGKSSSCLSSLSQQSYTSLDKFSSGHNRQSSFGGGERGGGLGAGGEGEGSVARGVADDGERYRIDGITNDLNGSLNENTSYPKFNNYNRECTLHPQINLSLSIPQPLATTISNKQLELNTTKNPIKFEQNSGLKKSTTMNNNNNNLQNENDMNSNNNGHNYNQFLNKYSNKTSNGDGIDNQRCVSPFPHIPFPPETDDPSYGKISPFPTIPPPINQQMQYVTLQGNVIRSVIPPGKGISVDYKVGSHGGPRPFNQGPMSPQMSGPRSPASYPPVQPQQQQQQQNWAQQPKPVGQSPYATLPRTNASQQDTTNSCDSPPLPPPPPPEFLKQIMENPVPKNTINLMNNNNSSLPTKSIEQEPKYIPGQATEMLANSVEKININNKKNFMIEASKVLSNLLEARIANNNNNNYNKNQMFAKANEETMAKPLPNHPLKNIIEICDTETIPCPEEPKPKNEVTLSKTELNTSTKNLTDNNCELKPIETVTFRNKNSNISDKSKRLSTQALDRRSYIEKDFARNGNKIANIPNDQLNAELAKNVSADLSDGKLPVCCQCNTTITKGPFITALGRIWCPEHFMCVNGSCRRPLQDIGFVEEKGDLYCEYCFEKYLAPTCSKCNNKIKGDCLNAIGRHFHPECFICAYCGKLFGNTPFFLEEGEPYCEADWNELFTTKCYACGFPVEAGDRWVEALNHNYHSQCFNCTMCRKNLEGTSFYNKGGRPYCKNHAR